MRSTIEFFPLVCAHTVNCHCHPLEIVFSHIILSQISRNSFSGETWALFHPKRHQIPRVYILPNQTQKKTRADFHAFHETRENYKWNRSVKNSSPRETGKLHQNLSLTQTGMKTRIVNGRWISLQMTSTSVQFQRIKSGFFLIRKRIFLILHSWTIRTFCLFKRCV